MLAFMRKFAKSWLAAVIFVPLLLVLGIAGFKGDVFQMPSSDYVIKVGGRVITSRDFKREFDTYKENLEQRFQQPISLELTQQQGLDRRVMEELAFREALDELLARMGLTASDKMFNEQLRKAPVFFDSVTGEFDPAKYRSALAERGLTPEIFKGVLTDEMRRNEFVSAAVSGLRAPRAYSAVGGLFALEQRDLAYFVVDPRIVGPVAQPTDAEVAAFVKQNAAQLTLPEFRALTIVRFNAKDYESAMTVTEAEVQKQFDFMKDSLSRAELRTVVQITAKDAAQATAISARLNKGEDPAAVAKSVGATHVVYADKPRSSFFDKAIATAAFSLPAGRVSGPVKGQLGYVVVKVTSITPGTTANLADHRAEIEAKIRGDLAGARISDMSKVYEDAHEAGASLTEAAAKAGAPIMTVLPVTADGRGQDGKPIAGVSPEMLKAAFELAQGGESDIQDAGEGQYFAVRVDRIVPPAMPPMDVVRPQLIRTMMMRKEAERMQAKAEELSARVRKGESIDAVAASVGASVVRVAGLSRATAQAHESLGRELLGGALGSKKGEPFTARANGFAIAVALVTAVRTGDPQQVAQATEQGRAQFTQELFGDIGQAARGYARTRLKAKTDLVRARVAIGIDPAVAAQGQGATPPADEDQ